MQISKVDTPKVEDVETNKGLRTLRDKINEVADIPILSGLLLEGVPLTTSETSIRHKLGRKPLGFFVVGRSANAVVYGRSHTSRYLQLTASASCTVDLWVF